ncbi:MAG: hypothetical protein FWD49_04220 [Firmicutes bacterium]|nr:hypothetical protein [Bacillota bacterium]
MNQMGYAEYIRKEIANAPENLLFSADEICKRTAEHFDESKEKIRYTVNVVLNRMTGTEVLRYQKGVYYKPQQTVFGAVPINHFDTVYKQYIENGGNVIGYMTGATLCQKLGLTTQMPKHRFYASNKIVGREKFIAGANMVLRQPKTEVNADNYRYLQLLDIIDNKDGVAYEADDVLKKFGEILMGFNLDFKRLLGMAKRHYSQKVVTALVDIAERGVL